MSPTMLERIRPVLDEPCSGYRCGGGEAQFTRRRIGAAVTIHLQCQSCGKSLTGALRRAEFYTWQDFPAWDEEIRTTWDEGQRAQHIEYAQDINAARERRAADAAVRRAEYSRWLLTSPEWRTLRDRVWRRAGGTCEACLANRAGDIHHVTYALGRLPPAWELRAVCRQCHDRLHDWTGGEE